MSKPFKKPNLDSVTTINEDGSHFTLHPADVRGRFALWRRILGVLMLVVYVALPWIPINGFPAVFFDIAHRRFHLFGLTFVAEDLPLAFFAISGLGFSLFYLTSLFGRLWCGWTCPYTVFLEHIYRRIERWVDGDATQRRALDRRAWDRDKIVRRVVKHTLYLLCSALIAHIFLSYFVSLRSLYEYMQASPFEHFTSFFVVAFLTGALYFSFSWFREQFCIILCPYGRIQSALTDDNTVVIGYDQKRGEPRGKASDPSNGSCIDCNRCVQVCPTGIDIRNGLQMECIGCAACIDACDEVMTKLSRPRGLVRYDSLNGLAGGKTRLVRPRTILYTGLLLLGLMVLTLFLRGMHTARVDISRMTGNTYYLDGTTLRNQYTARLLTKRDVETTFSASLRGAPDGAKLSGFETPAALSPYSEEERPFFIQLPAGDYQGPFTAEVVWKVNPGDFEMVTKVSFLGPSLYRLNEMMKPGQPETKKSKEVKP